MYDSIHSNNKKKENHLCPARSLLKCHLYGVILLSPSLLVLLLMECNSLNYNSCCQPAEIHFTLRVFCLFMFVSMREM